MKGGNKKRVPKDLISNGEIVGLGSRKISQETCKKFNYQVATYKGKPVQVAPYYDKDGNLVAQKLRTKDKKFSVLGNFPKALPFGSQAWPIGGRKLVLTEGEIDAMSIAQLWDCKYPVWSIGCGADKPFDDFGKPLPMTGISKYIAKYSEFFKAFDEVVLCFDQDDPGQRSAEVAAKIIGHRARIARLPLNDASEMIQAGRGKELIDAVYKAQPYRPEGMLSFGDLKDKVRETPGYGHSWPWPELTEMTYGIQSHYIYTFGAATGAGKSDILAQVAQHLNKEHRLPVGLFMMENEPREVAMWLASKQAGKLLHTPEGYDEEAFEKAWGELDSSADIFIYDSFGLNEWGPVAEHMEYLYHTYGVKHFIVDNLSSFSAAAMEDERKTLELIMGEMSSLVTKYGLTVFLVSHLNTPDGKPHEEGGRVTARNLKGARGISQWSHGIIGLERDQQHEDREVRHTTTVRILKLRRFGWKTGECTWLKFDEETGLLVQTDNPEQGPDEYGFQDEKEEDGQPGESDF